MLTHFRKLHQTGTDARSPFPKWRKWPAILAALCCAMPASVGAQNGPAYPPQGMPPAIRFQQALPQSATPQSTIQQVQNTPQSARAIHQLIEDMPQSQEELEIIQRRSQLVVTRANVTRVAIADPSVMEIVQYSPKEFSIVGLGMGSTTLTLWFENVPDPLIYTVKTVRDPNLDNQRKLDYGKLEKKLALVFPNSKVYLQPMSFKILVRGQARDSNEAAHILAVIRGEIINQEGSLFGPQGLGGFGGGLNTGGYAGGVAAGGYGSGYFGQQGGIIGGVGGLNAFDLAASFIINELQVPGEFQIALRVRVAELSRTAADHAGVNINVLFNDARNIVHSSLGAATGTLSGTFENGEIGILLDWLCSNGTAKILAEPTATVLSGRSTRFLAGGEFAVPTIVGVGGAAGTTTSFRGFGTTIQATPTVIDRDNIRIGVIAEYSNISTQNTVSGIPGLNTRRIDTVVEMREGQTIAMAGLLSNRLTTQVQRIPLLGDIPKIGPLFFSNKTLTHEENELLILITPELVRPIDAHEVPPVPGFDVTRPSHEQFWKMNMTEGPPDTGYYHSAPYGSGTTGTNVDYQHFNPGPAGSMQSPVPTNPGPAAGSVQGPGQYQSTPQFNGAPPFNGVPQFNGGPQMNGGPPLNGTPQQYGTPPLNGTSQNRQLYPVPQASAQRPSMPQQYRQQPSQVIPTGNPGIRQTNYATPTGQQRDRRSDRQSRVANQQQ